MVTIYDVDQQELVERAAEELKKVNAVKPPVWAGYVKTGVSKERPPANDCWWYLRAASILKTVYKLGPIGVSKLKTKYGSRQRRGVAPPIFRRGSGNIIRKSLQQLEKAGLIKHVEKGVHKGKIITPAGKSFLDRVAADIIKSPSVKKEKDIKTMAEKPQAVVSGRQESRGKPSAPEKDKERKYPKKEDRPDSDKSGYSKK